MIPNKTDVLAYIDNSGPVPARYVHVVLDVRATPDPHYADILVGPLPIKNGTTTWVSLEYTYTRKTQGRIRNLDADSIQNRAFLKKVGADVQDITLGLWGMTAAGDNATMQIWAVDPVNQEGGKITVWHQFVKNSVEGWDTGSIMPSGLYFVADLTGRDSSKWSLQGWLYNNIFYSTTNELRAAFRAPGFEKLSLNYEGEWDSVDHQEPTPPQDTRTPPIAIAPGGDRYSVDTQQKYVEWMDFSFYVGFSRDTGMALYDIKYKGERVLYELGLQEALAHYAGEQSPSNHYSVASNLWRRQRSYPSWNGLPR
jgi:primary-amine oxidase